MSSGCEINAAELGVGRHDYYLTPEQRQQALKYSFIGISFCITSLVACKVSICASFLRFLEGSQAQYKRLFLHSVAILVFVMNVAFITTLFTQCSPVSRVWDPNIKGSCWDPNIERDVMYWQGGQLFCQKILNCYYTDGKQSCRASPTCFYPDSQSIFLRTSESENATR